jgi:hypothetical protein
MRENIAKIETELACIALNFRIWQRELFEELRRMNREVTESAVSHLFAQLAVKYADLDNVGTWLQDAKADLIEHAEALLLSENPAAQGEWESPSQIDGFSRYVVNVIVDSAETRQAPVIYEDHPTHPNLFGRIEHQARMGTLLTDFKLIKPGAVHLANGGYLVLDAAKVVSQPDDLGRIETNHAHASTADRGYLRIAWPLQYRDPRARRNPNRREDRADR